MLGKNIESNGIRDNIGKRYRTHRVWRQYLENISRIWDLRKYWENISRGEKSSEVQHFCKQ